MLDKIFGIKSETVTAPRLIETYLDDIAIDRYAVFRYGKLCRMKGDDTPVSVYSVTKTLGEVMAGRVSFLTREVE